MDRSTLRTLAVVGLLVVAFAWLELKPSRAAEPSPGRQGLYDERLTPEAERAALRFAPSVTPADRAWILAAVARARPEARALLDRVDGLVEVQLHGGGAPGFARFDGRGGIVVSFDPRIAVHEYGSGVREHVVLHELGHVVDEVLVPAALKRTLDADIPRAAPCDQERKTGACASPTERFADTFARWALKDFRLDVPVGYLIDLPPSVESWGELLRRGAAQPPRAEA